MRRICYMLVYKWLHFDDVVVWLVCVEQPLSNEATPEHWTIWHWNFRLGF